MLTIRYRLTGTGWSECDLASEEMSVTISASYMSDALGDLSRAVLELVQGEGESRCSFEEEPGEYRWIFTRTDGEAGVDLHILWFNDAFEKQPDERGKEVFAAATTMPELVRALVAALDEVRDSHGVEGYRERWVEHDFPEDEHAALAAAAGIS